MTERLYYIDSHLTEFTARVVDVAATGDDRVSVTLDRTAFYPTGGGQPFDTGAIGAARVIDCIDAESEGVQHIIDGRPPQLGATLDCRVDWSRRLDHLQQHTAQHILSQAFVKLFNAETRGFRIMDAYAEIDVALDEPSDSRITEGVELANRIVWQNRPVRVHFATAGEVAQRGLHLRKISKRAGALRIIEIEDFDANACGGTHARATGEIGSIVVRAWERARGLTRVEFLAGNRALRDYAQANRTTREAAAMLGVGRDNLAEAAARLIEDNKQLARHARALEETALHGEANELLAQATSNSEGVRIIARTFEGRDVDSLKGLALGVIAHSRVVALLGSIDGDVARLIFARSTDTNGDMNTLMREACASLNGRGGGRADLAQGGGRGDAQQLAEVISTLAARLT